MFLTCFYVFVGWDCLSFQVALCSYASYEIAMVCNGVDVIGNVWAEMFTVSALPLHWLAIIEPYVAWSNSQDISSFVKLRDSMLCSTLVYVLELRVKSRFSDGCPAVLRKVVNLKCTPDIIKWNNQKSVFGQNATAKVHSTASKIHCSLHHLIHNGPYSIAAWHFRFPENN